MSAALDYGQALAAKLGADDWLTYWASIHESGHATVARHLGWPVKSATLNCVKIPHPEYRIFDDPASISRLIISCSGNMATTMFLGFTHTGTLDDLCSHARLRDLGARESQIRRLMGDARRDAVVLVRDLKPQIIAVAAVLRHRRVMQQAEIDLLMDYTG